MIQSEKLLSCPKVIMGTVASGKSSILLEQATQIANSNGSSVLFIERDYLIDLILEKKILIGRFGTSLIQR